MIDLIQRYQNLIVASHSTIFIMIYSSAVGVCSAAVFAYYFLSVCHRFFLISWARRNQNASISQIYNSLEHPLLQHLCICVCHFLYTTRSVLESGAPSRLGVRKLMVILVLTSLCFTAQSCKCTEVKPFEIVLNFSQSQFFYFSDLPKFI